MRHASRQSDIRGTLHATITDDGDVSLKIDLPEGGARFIQFCTGLGGGRSPLVRKALVALVEAMMEENSIGRYPTLGENIVRL